MNRLPSELLELSKRLLGQAKTTPNQAALRRAISTAYYALFHLLTLEAARMFVRSTSMTERMVRAYDHGKMAKTSKVFARGDLPTILHPLKDSFNDPKIKETVDRLKAVAQTFVDLQEARHDADYNLSRRFEPIDARILIDLAESAFSDWSMIRRDYLARIYLFSFLTFDAWNKER